ncbi:hypothetical protein K469DRAFT_688141 [Zopfia rhizophila CBS 207.26]|uniref:Reverse transcriptase domain-containing protein n=1 Tax=Zopfia rhizophila CBS 207.26 TaxID=1314779 RepID=A0A6A6E661_9PEZI|nr:hypothetical protein K469DRAFT_688141 [Zopfia rhizophila CBS 207.26]
MASSGSVFSETLQTITTTKLEELAKQRANFEGQYSALLIAVKAEQNPLKRLFLLVGGAKVCLGVKTAFRKNKVDGRLGRVISGGTSNARLETDLKNLDRFLEQARYDPSISPEVLQDWEKSILQYLEDTSSDGDVEMAESFEEVPGARKLAARPEWEKVVFEPTDVNLANLEKYLHDLFLTNKDVSKAVKVVRGKVEQFEGTMASSGQFTRNTLHWVIRGLQSSDLLDNEKRAVLKDFLQNEIILSEIADVLNMRLSALERWTWGTHVPLEQRRKLNGSYSIYMHEDLLQAIFLHYLGVQWSVFFKKALASFRKDKAAWKSIHATIPKIDRKRRAYYLGDEDRRPNLQAERRSTHRNTYFLHQHLDHESQQIEVEEGEEEAEFQDFVPSAGAYGDEWDDGAGPRKRSRHDRDSQPANREAMLSRLNGTQAAQQHDHHHQQQQQQQQQQQHVSRQGYGMATQNAHVRHSLKRPQMMPPVTPSQRRSNPYYYGDSETDDDRGYRHGPKQPMKAKQDLLHLLSTEIIVNTRLYGELTCFRSVFESWNPLLPHTSVIAALEFFGVSKKWRAFFETFLQAPLKFMDDESASPRLRRRGTPGSHTLSDVFGEVVLFCLDFSINQSTDGSLLYRLCDDFWFWSPEYEECVTAWGRVSDFAQAMGVTLNQAKTGTVRICRNVGGNPGIDSRLPKGQIRWGFLCLDPSSGRFEIDQKMVDSHVEELRKQLQAPTSAKQPTALAPAEGADEFFSFEEYVKYREEFNGGNKADLVALYRELLKRPREESIDASVEVKQALDQLRTHTGSPGGIMANWSSMEAYWKWVAQMYGPEMVERFGGLSVVDPGLLPIGMVSLFRDRRVKWQG